MSFFNSILASIGGNDPRSKPTTPAPTGAPQPTSANSTTSKTTHINGQVSAGTKRKVEAGNNEPAAKVQRSDIAPPPSLPQVETPPVGKTPLQRDTKPSDPKPTSSTRVTAKNTASGPLAKLPPPKGSYREILARAEAAKSSQNDFGKIKHKVAEKQTRRERLLQAQEAATKAKEAAKQSRAVGQHKVDQLRKPDASQLPHKKRQPPDLGYKGTMRSIPQEPAYKGTVRHSSTTGIKQTSRVKSSESEVAVPRYRYARYSDEEDYDEEEDDDASDMEGNGFDALEAEEEYSLRMAKKEDEEALREEDEHRRLKAERRKKLENLAANRKR